jgi:hypothetical protein
VQKRKFRDSVMKVDDATSVVLRFVPEMKGALSKKFSRHWTWQERWFVTQGAYLVYYDDEAAAAAAAMASAKPLAAIDIRHLVSVELEDPVTVRLVLSDTRNSYLLRAESNSLATEWASNLSKRREVLLAALKEAQVEGVRPRSGSSVNVKDATLTPKTLATITDDELMALSSIKQQFASENYKELDSALCLRFLRARKGVVPDAIEFLRQHLEWRRATFPIEYVRPKRALRMKRRAARAQRRVPPRRA